MTNNFYPPITPPPELVKQWLEEYYGTRRTGEVNAVEQHLATQAARWGADQELEACISWMRTMGYWGEDGCAISKLRAARRPKPPSLKEQALEALAHILNNSSTQLGADTIRRALESLPD